MQASSPSRIFSRPSPVPNLKSLQTLFSSPELTVEMAILYLHEHMRNSQALDIIVPAFRRFSTEELADWVPFITHIWALSKAGQIEAFLQDMAVRCIPLYLCVRWSYSTYIDDEDELDKARNKLDTKFVNALSNKASTSRNPKQFTTEQIEMMIKRKQILSNYVNILNNFYQKLFRYPEKLAQQPGPSRKQQLQSYLPHLLHKFSQHQESTRCAGICLPFCQTVNQAYNQSYLLVNFVERQCLPFSTRERVPFKIVFETVNFDDYDIMQSEVEKVRKVHGDFEGVSHRANEDKHATLVLPHSYFGEDWVETVKKITIQSPYGHLPSYRIHSYLVKSGDDIRQQHMAMQLIQLFHKIFAREHLKLWVKPYQIIPYNKSSGLIQFVDGTKTISCLKSVSNQTSLRTIYKQIYGENWETAITNFTYSLAGYSLFQYLFQVKDRHNNNILVDSLGHLVHIDFSFMISNSPGGINFEKAPFKLTQDYVELMEGLESDIFLHFKFLLSSGLKYLKKYKKQILGVLDIMRECQDMKCFTYFDRKEIERRFHEGATDSELEVLVENLVSQAYSSYSTGNYDLYQWYTNQIHS